MHNFELSASNSVKLEVWCVVLVRDRVRNSVRCAFGITVGDCQHYNLAIFCYQQPEHTLDEIFNIVVLDKCTKQKNG